MPLPDPATWDRLPTVTRLRSRPLASFVAAGSVWEVGWNGDWVKAWRSTLADAKRANGVR